MRECAASCVRATATLWAARRRAGLRLLLLGLLLQGGCVNTAQLISAFNTPPQILLISPSPGEDGDPLEVPELEGLLVTVQVADAEDRSETLLVRWSGLRTDGAAPDDADPADDDDDDADADDDDDDDDDDASEGVDGDESDDLSQELGEAAPDSTGWLELLVVGLAPGAWHVTIEVVDTDGATAEVGLSVLVGVANAPPSLAEVELGEDPAYETTVLECEPIGWDDAEDADPGFRVAWFVDDDELEGPETFCDGDDERCELDGEWFDRGDAVFCTLTPDDGELLGDPVTSNTVTIRNTPPEAPGVSMSPSPAAHQDDDLVCSVAEDAEDVDGDEILNPDDYEVLWYLDGFPAPEYDGVWTIPASDTALGQEWICEVRASDGEDLGESARANTTVLPLDGDLVIGEYHPAPESVSDAAGEWIELFNASLTTINLSGFELLDDGEDSHLILGDVVVSPGARVVLGRNEELSSNGAVSVDYQYSGFVLDDSEDAIVLAFDGVEVDRVEYDLSPYGADVVGHSVSLDPTLGLPNSELNDDGANWCLSGVPLGALDGDFGTPGDPNGACVCFESDGDGDGWGDDSSCAPPDCDDEDASIHPGAEDLCENGIDENCDGMDAVCACLDTDDDGDGYGDGLACVDIDCNDDPAAGGADAYPGAVELCDGVDNDCNGLADAGAAGVPDQEVDADGDGDLVCDGDCDDSDARWNLADNDGDSYSSCTGDCDDGDPLRHVMLTEVCDGIDNDCDGVVPADETDDDGDG